MPIRVLDAGSGLGQYSFYLAKKHSNWRITGVDIKSEEISACKSFFDKCGYTNVEFIEANLTKFKKQNGYDLILSVDVMEHIEDDQTVFYNFYESLAQDGFLVINTPSDKGGSDVSHQKQKSFIEEHVRNGYGIEEIESKLKKAGFKQVKSQYTYGIPGHISWMLSMKYPLLCLGVSKWFFLAIPLYYFLLLPAIIILNLADLHLHHKSGTGLLVQARKI